MSWVHGLALLEDEGVGDLPERHQELPPEALDPFAQLGLALLDDRGAAPAVDDWGRHAPDDGPHPAVEQVGEVVGLEAGRGAQPDGREAVGHRGGHPVVGGGQARLGGADVGAALEQVARDADRGERGQLGQGRGVALHLQGAGAQGDEHRELMLQGRDPGLELGHLGFRALDLLALLEHLDGVGEPLREALLHQREEQPVELRLAPQEVEGGAGLHQREPEVGEGRREGDGEGLALELGGRDVCLGGVRERLDAAPQVDLVRGADVDVVALHDIRLDGCDGAGRANREARGVDPRGAGGQVGRDLGPAPGARLGRDRPGLDDPLPGLLEVQVLGQQAIHQLVELGVVEGGPPAGGRGLSRALGGRGEALAEIHRELGLVPSDVGVAGCQQEQG